MQLGMHYIADYEGCDPIIKNADWIIRLMQEMVLVGKFNIVGNLSHKFYPTGCSVIFMLKESHMSIHTWPEHGALCFDAFSCNLDSDLPLVGTYLKNKIGAKGFSQRLLRRGTGVDSRMALGPLGSAPAWGHHLILNLYDCSSNAIRSSGNIRSWIETLCSRIDMRTYGDPIIVRFGDDPRVGGFSALQLIETSNIAAHFAEFTNTAYIDIFSCKSFSVEEAVDTSIKYFGGIPSYTVVERR